MSEYQIGLAVGTLTALDELETPLPDPMPDFLEYRSKDRLGDMSLKGRGPRTAIWSMAILEDLDQRAQMDLFVTGDPVYIRTKKRDDTFAVFEVKMNILEPRDDGARLPGFVGTRFENEYEFIIVREVV